MVPEVKKNATTRLNRIAGQIGGIQRMVDEDKYCIDILTQIAAVRAALDKAGLVILKSHLQNCVADAVRAGKTNEAVEELDRILTKFI
jgi:DNA-binding FrmR family transcriptional regulator